MTNPPTIISVQSWVATGHVGNSVAQFALQRLGFEVCALPTTLLSNHPGHGHHTGQATDPTLLAALVEGVAARGILAGAAALLTGYLATEANAAIALDLPVRILAATLYCCDPVLGDDGRLYVAPGIVGLLAARALPRADILTPNQFELGLLAGTHPRSLPAARAAAAGLSARMRPDGPRLVLVTSLVTDATPPSMIDLLLHGPGGDFLLRRPRLARHFSGAGDLLAALFLGRLLGGLAPPGALAMSVSAVEAVLAATGADELALIAAQDALARPPPLPAPAALA
jgi:pyridoxine kinase